MEKKQEASSNGSRLNEILSPDKKSTDLEMFMDNLGAGTVKDLLERLISDISLACMIQSEGKSKARKGTLKLDLTLYPHSEVDLLVVEHKINYSMPTSKGQKSEVIVGDCSFYVGKGGQLNERALDEDWRGQLDMFGGH